MASTAALRRPTVLVGVCRGTECFELARGAAVTANRFQHPARADGASLPPSFYKGAQSRWGRWSQNAEGCITLRSVAKARRRVGLGENVQSVLTSSYGEPSESRQRTCQEWGWKCWHSSTCGKFRSVVAAAIDEDRFERSGCQTGRGQGAPGLAAVASLRRAHSAGCRQPRGAFVRGGYGRAATLMRKKKRRSVCASSGCGAGGRQPGARQCCCAWRRSIWVARRAKGGGGGGQSKRFSMRSRVAVTLAQCVTPRFLELARATLQRGRLRRKDISHRNSVPNLEARSAVSRLVPEGEEPIGCANSQNCAAAASAAMASACGGLGEWRQLWRNQVLVLGGVSFWPRGIWCNCIGMAGQPVAKSVRSRATVVACPAAATSSRLPSPSGVRPCASCRNSGHARKLPWRFECCK